MSASQVLLMVAVCAWGCSLPEGGDGEWDAPQPLLSSESTEWDAIPNLDDFFRRIYKCAASAGHCSNGTLCGFVRAPVGMLLSTAFATFFWECQ